MTRWLPTCASSWLALVAVAQQAPSPPVRPNAADVYRLALAEARQRLEVEAGGVMDTPMQEESDETVWRFDQEGWPALVEKASPALALFAQAAQVERCEFGPAEDPLFVGYDEVGLQLTQLAELVAAHGWHQLSTSPAGALADARTLLRHACHVRRQPTTWGASCGRRVENLGLALLRELLRSPTADEERREAGAKLLREHAAARGSRLDLVDNAERQMQRMVDATFLRRTPLEDAGDGTMRAAQQHGAAVAARIRELTHAAFEPMRRDPPATVTQIQAHVREFDGMLAKGTNAKQVEREVANMTREQIVDVLSRQCTRLLLPNLVALAEGELQGEDLLRQCRDLVSPPARQR